MHGLINRAIQCFTWDTYGSQTWKDVVRRAGLDHESFEAMLHYSPDETEAVMAALEAALDKPREAILEDIGTYLVSNNGSSALRRLLRFGGVTFEEFLHSLDDLPERTRLAVPDLHLPDLELRENAPHRFSLLCHRGLEGFGHVMMGVLRAMADDYGALVFMEHVGRANGPDIIDISLIEANFAQGNSFDLAEGRLVHGA